MKKKMKKENTNNCWGVENGVGRILDNSKIKKGKRNDNFCK